MSKWTIKGPEGSFFFYDNPVESGSQAHYAGAAIDTHIVHIDKNIHDVCGYSYDELVKKNFLHTLPQREVKFLFLKPGVTKDDFEIFIT